MRKQIVALLALLTASGAIAQLEIPDATAGTGAWHNWTPFYGWLNEDWGNTYWGDEQGMATGGNIWANKASMAENQTISGGSGSLSRDISISDVTLYLNHNLDGRYRSVWNDNAAYANNRTTIIARDGEGEASFRGVASDTTHPNTFRAPDNAVVVMPFYFNPPWNRAVGDGHYTFRGGSYFGGSGYGGAFIVNAASVTIEGAAFIGGTTYGRDSIESRTVVENGGGEYPIGLGMSGDGGGLESGASGAYFKNVGAVSVSNRTGDATDRFEATTMDSSSNVTGGGDKGALIMVVGGDGLAVDGGSGTSTIYGGDFYGSRHVGVDTHSVNYTDMWTENATVTTRGGRGVSLVGRGKATIEDGRFYGGNGGNIAVGGHGASANSMGGEGLLISGSSSNPDIMGGTYRAGRSGEAFIVAVSPGYEVGSNDPIELPATDDNGTAIAMGASGIRLVSAGTATVGGVISTGSRGSVAIANGSNSVAEASGGSGLLASDTTVNINSGTFTGGDGGNARSAKGTGSAYGGAGAMAVGGTLDINGGTFTGGAGGRVNGLRQRAALGVWAQDANLAINQASADEPTTINGDIFFNNTGAQDLDILGGTIGGDIYKYGSGTANASVDSSANFSGAFFLMEGNASISLADETQGAFFSNVDIGADSTMAFAGSARAVTAAGSRFMLAGTNSSLSFATGAELSLGTIINAGFGTVQTTNGSDLIMRDNSSVTVAFDSLSGDRGLLEVAGTLVVSNDSKIVLSGVSATPEGRIQVVNAAAVELGGNAVEDVVDVDTGWLNRQKDVVVSSGIRVDYEYNSLTNTTLNDIDNNLLGEVDDMITSLSPTEFRALNSVGEADATSQFRYSLSQVPDVSESSFRVSQQVHEQIAARGTEYRSMNGFASSKPFFDNQNRPAGAAGPQTQEDESSMEGWVRAYGSFGNKDKTSLFSAYDSSTVGSVIGVDRSFGKLLVGIAGGYASTDLDATAYQADVDTYHGSIYSTVGGESIYVDLALTIGVSDTEAKNAATTDEFDSSFMSLYAGFGKSFEVMEKISITPEASILLSHYEQEEYSRVGLLDGAMVDDYDTDSCQSSLGVNVATVHQLDWLSQGLAVIPEIRAHWLHVFEADPDDFTYNVGGAAYTFGVRPRDEESFRLGVGFDVWSWKYQRTKFEIDYDGLFSDTYREHIFSGKVTFQF